MSTDFFQRQRQARRHTLWLRLGFVVAILAVIVMVTAVVVLSVGRGLHMSLAQVQGWMQRAPDFPLKIAGLTAAIILVSSAWKAWQLRGGGAAVAESLGGRLVRQNPVDPAHKRLLNVVEEISLAAQMPVPSVYVLPGEPGINAFAAGRREGTAVIAVTAGALMLLDRDELQAVIAHEFSHILNGDMALNTRIIAWLAGLYSITGLARMLSHDSEREGKFDFSSLAIWPLVLGLYIAGSFGTVTGRVLQAAISRRREELADAAAVQFTRNPQALRTALPKVAAADGGGDIDSVAAADAAHLFFAETDIGWISRFRLRLFATHPPMLKRLRALDPALTPQRFEALLIAQRRQLREREQLVARG